MTIHSFNFDVVDPSWRNCCEQALSKMDKAYLNQLSESSTWLPGPEKIFSAFSLPIEKVNFVLFGESPYPRRESANGFAFWDNAVEKLWSPTGLDKKVNRATSLRNILKMLLVAEGKLDAKHTGQDDVAKIDKTTYVKTNKEFFNNFLQHGFLLLNASPVLQENTKPQKDAKAWHPFVQTVLHELLTKRPEVQFILLGKIANTIDKLLPNTSINKLYAEHPYNLSFINNPEILSFFKQLHLLKK